MTIGISKETLIDIKKSVEDKFQRTLLENGEAITNDDPRMIRHITALGVIEYLISECKELPADPK